MNPSTMSHSQPCPCGRRAEGQPRTYDTCCGPLHRREATADSAETLMRSRFSAFSLGQIDYLLATHRPPTPDPDARQKLIGGQNKTRWWHLEILSTRAGSPTDTDGNVEFIATFEETDRPYRLREHSTFQRHLGEWVYVTGTPTVEAIDLAAIGRNAPCWCGSGKKLKKCHR